ncbi:hypothetical protein PIB30_084193 [Stylosanthes scabra]|uniref:Uncharacterized protein n=1 Tax=Stylosanthes scabra TaxID=79078 RepID=A0ABU6ZRB5_9FABA|nr:hypothetical protein [Stylosanthes scabra]
MKHLNSEDYAHNKWLCMESIHATDQLAGPIHARKCDPAEDLIKGDKLKKTFRVTCNKCREKGHNFKTCKGAAANPNWKPTTRRKRRGSSFGTAAAEINGEVEANENQAQDIIHGDIGNDPPPLPSSPQPQPSLLHVPLSSLIVCTTLRLSSATPSCVAKLVGALLFYYDRMIYHCVELNHYTFSILINASGGIGFVGKGEKGHAKVEEGNETLLIRVWISLPSKTHFDKWA